MISGFKIYELPNYLWSCFCRMLINHICLRGNFFIASHPIWVNIPSKNRIHVSIQELKQSIVPKKKELIGLDYGKEIAAIANGEYWLYMLEKRIANYHDNSIPTESDDLYIFDNKMSFIICYISESNDIFIFGDNTKLILKQ